jgi:N-6 DNA Methylase/Eco57I restriction-modification methylase
MVPGISGRLLSSQFVTVHLEEETRSWPPVASHAHGSDIRRLWEHIRSQSGPASSVRALTNEAALPLVRCLGFVDGVRPRVCVESWQGLLVAAPGTGLGLPVGLLVIGWGASLDRAWADAVGHGHEHGLRWCFVYNGTHLRLLDVARAYARRFIEFDLDLVLSHQDAVVLFQRIAGASAFSSGAGDGDPCRLDLLIQRADLHGVRLCDSLRAGVVRALEAFTSALWRAEARKTSLPADHLAVWYEQALTAVYRILFLLFAEARGLVPMWHAIYREAYAVEPLRDRADTGASPVGLWSSLQAIARLAHAGCDIEGLRVTPFNGRLFSPARAPLLDGLRLEDRVVSGALRALSSAEGRRGHARERIAYRDLDVEELGGVYESLLDYAPAADKAAPTVVLTPACGRVRKATGSFYTPRTITESLVRDTLAPLTTDRSPEEILALRVVDPAMGSGAFLVAACRFLAQAYETALVHHGRLPAADISDEERASFRRAVAQRCLFGVDLNPMAVQLARLSLWLTTMAADHPLSFLDHHLVCGDSLVGTSPDAVQMRPPGGSRAPRAVPLFEAQELETALAAVQPIRAALELCKDDSLQAVRRKEALLAEFDRSSDRMRWTRVCDLWCAAWFLPRPPSRGEFHAITDAALGRATGLSASVVARWTERVASVVPDHRFLHWPLQFPEVFFDEDGRRLPNGGFDAVLGNPPWEMLRHDGERTRDDVRARVRFARASGEYATPCSGHPNEYQLFAERAVQLTRQGGRIGLVVPAGLMMDHGSAGLRRWLFRHCTVDRLVGFENRTKIFPIHRSVRFLLLTASRGGSTDTLRCRFGLQSLDALDASDARSELSISIRLLERLSGPDLTIPDVRSAVDLRLAERLAAEHRPLSDGGGWNATFGRELNATEDRDILSSPSGQLVVIEGKHLTPFHVDIGRARGRADERAVQARLSGRQPFVRRRLAYRDVASATNQLTLIAALVPVGCVTTHTIFCLSSPLPHADQRVLCALLNSLVANYLVRMRVTTHVTVAVVERLPVPRVARSSEMYRELVAVAASLERAQVLPITRRHSRRAPSQESREAAGSDGPSDAYVRLQALAARSYGLTHDEFAHVLTTFPLIDASIRERALDVFIRRK